MDVTSTSISMVQYNKYGCHKRLYQQGTVQPVRMTQTPLSARYSTTSTDVTSTSINKVQYNQYGCHKHLYQQGTTHLVRMSQALLSASYSKPVRMSQGNLSARYSTNSTDVTSTSICKVQYNQYGCHNHLYQQGTVKPVRFHKHLYQQGTT